MSEFKCQFSHKKTKQNTKTSKMFLSPFRNVTLAPFRPWIIQTYLTSYLIIPPNLQPQGLCQLASFGRLPSTASDQIGICALSNPLTERLSAHTKRSCTVNVQRPQTHTHTIVDLKLEKHSLKIPYTFPIKKVCFSKWWLYLSRCRYKHVLKSQSCNHRAPMLPFRSPHIFCHRLTDSHRYFCQVGLLL